MKKIILTSLSLAALALLGSSCQKPETEADAPATLNGQKVLITVSAEDDATKATEANNEFRWEAGDKIHLVADNALPVPATLKEGAGSKNATFEAETDIEAPKYVVYPTEANIMSTMPGMEIIVFAPSVDNYTSGKIVTPMIGKATTAADGKVSANLKHLCGLIEVKVSDMQAGINKMVFTAVNPISTYSGLYLMNGSDYSAPAIIAGDDEAGMLSPDEEPAFEFTFNFEAVAANTNMTFYVPVAANSTFGKEGFKVELYKGSEVVSTKNFPLPESGYTVKRANILRNLTMTAAVLEFAEDYSSSVYNWMGGTYSGEGHVKPVVVSNIPWKVTTDKDWATATVDGDKIIMALSRNNAPGARKFTLTIAPEDESLAYLAKTVTMSEGTGWTGGTGWAINEETGTATISGTISGNANFNTYYTTSTNTATYTWNFSEFNITAGNFLIQHWPADDTRIVLNLKSDGTLAFRVGKSEKTINLLSHDDPNKRLNNLNEIKSIKILGYRWNSNWRASVNNLEYISISYSEIGKDLWPSSYKSFCFWTGVQNTTGTVTMESFEHTNQN